MSCTRSLRKNWFLSVINFSVVCDNHGFLVAWLYRIVSSGGCGTPRLDAFPRPRAGAAGLDDALRRHAQLLQSCRAMDGLGHAVQPGGAAGLVYRRTVRVRKGHDRAVLLMMIPSLCVGAIKGCPWPGVP